jgi:hypothetical protein
MFPAGACFQRRTVPRPVTYSQPSCHRMLDGSSSEMMVRGGSNLPVLALGVKCFTRSVVNFFMVVIWRLVPSR